MPELAQLVEAARAAPEAPALVPRRATLTPPGTGLIRTIKGHEAGVRAVAVLPDGKRALTGSSDRTARLWDLASGKELQRFEGHEAGVWAVAVLPDGKRALTGSYDRTARLWDLASGEQLAVFTADGAISCLAVTPDGRLAVAGDALGRIHVLEIRL
jgi:WD40 repeat protein